MAATTIGSSGVTFPDSTVQSTGGSPAKAWVSATITASNPTVNGSYNVTSITFTAPNIFVVNFTSNMPNVNYSVYAHCSQDGTLTYCNQTLNLANFGFATYSLVPNPYTPIAGYRIFASVH